MSSYPNAYLYKRIVQAKLYIDAHFHDPIDLDNIADEAFFSKFHFIRLFRKAYGYTPHQYLTKVRINEARELLKKGMMVGDVCIAVGFDSPGSFTSLFRKNCGLTPSAFRSEWLKRRSRIAESPLEFIPHCFATSKGWT